MPINHPDWCKLVQCDCGQVMTERRKRLDVELGFEPELLSLNWSHLRPVSGQTNAVAAVRGWAQRPVGWLYLVGCYGSGKTTLLSIAVNHLRAHGTDALFANVPTTLQYLRDCLGRQARGLSNDLLDVLDWLKRVPVLALDDLGSERMTEWAAEQLYEVLNYRYVKRLPTIIASNYGIDDLLDRRLASRIADASLTQQIDCGDIDVRRLKRD